MADIIEAEPLAQLDYAEVVDADSFAVPNPLEGNLRLLAAVRIGRARLIDNVGVDIGPQSAQTQGATATAASTEGSSHKCDGA